MLNKVQVRDPNVGNFGEPLEPRAFAKKHWVYAVMSDSVYEESRLRALKRRKPQLAAEEALRRVRGECKEGPPVLIPSEWERWPPLHSNSEELTKYGLHYEIYERKSGQREIAVVFEGTNFSEIPDWGANLRWLLRFVPGVKDQYTLVASEVASRFSEKIRDPSGDYLVSDETGSLSAKDGSPIRIVAVGHSLGGGLAQHFAYSMVQRSETSRGPKVSEVFAFNTSPVTAWFSAKDPPRTYNVTGLTVNRIHEYGEVLSFLRLFTSRLALSVANPAIWEYRYDTIEGGPIANHSISHLACNLATLSGEPLQRLAPNEPRAHPKK